MRKQMIKGYVNTTILISKIETNYSDFFTPKFGIVVTVPQGLQIFPQAFGSSHNFFWITWVLVINISLA